jgi:hypothetical protein
VWENFTKNRLKKSEKKGVLRSKKGVLGVKKAFFSVFSGSKSGHFSKIMRYGLSKNQQNTTFLSTLYTYLQQNISFVRKTVKKEVEK